MFNPIKTGAIVDVNVNRWVEAARNDPILFVQRQCTDIVLTAIGLSPDLHETLVLKGGTLMAIAFRSERVTADVDFTSISDPEGLADRLVGELNAQIPRAIQKLGYLDLDCKVQSVEKRPRPQNFENLQFPALLIRLGYAQKGSRQEAALARGKAANVVEIEISFRDQVYHFQELRLEDAQVSVKAFSLSEIIAEKLRALFQQITRDRYRRQDVYDIAFLIENIAINEHDKTEILDVLKLKCESRGIKICIDSIDNPELKSRARDDWETIRLEIPDLPEFDAQFEQVRLLYYSLPWK